MLTITPNFTGAKIKISRDMKGNDLNSMPLLFNHVKKIVDECKLPANIKTSQIELPRVNENAINKLKELGIKFETIG